MQRIIREQVVKYETSIRIFLMYSIDDLRTFHAIAEMAGVTSGARRVGISAATASHRLNKLERALGGIKEMGGLPDVLFIIDTNKEHIAVAEAKGLGIPVVAI